MVPLTVSMPWVLRQLKVSGVAWERQQQLRWITHKERDYQMTYEYNRKDNKKFMHEVAIMVFTPSKWTLLRMKTEAEQLEAYLVSIKLGGSGYQLVIARVRNWPYKTVAGLKDHNLLRLASRLCRRCLDPYTASFVQHYAMDITGQSALAELELVSLSGDTDTSSVEREHSVVAAKASETSSHKLELPYCGAGRMFRTEFKTGFWLVKEPEPSAAMKRKRDEIAAGGDGNTEAKRRALSAWQAFTIENANGRCLTPPVVRELAIQYSAIEPDEAARYVYIAKLASTCAKYGEPARKKHRSAPRTAVAHGETVGDESVEDDVGMAAAVGDAEHAGALVPGDSGAISPCVQRFRLDSMSRLKAEWLGDRAEKAENARMELMLSEHSAEGDRANKAASTWRVMGCSGSNGGSTGFIEAPGGLCTTLTYHEDTDTIKEAMAEAAKHTTLEDASRKWDILHRQHSRSACPTLPFVPADRLLCHDAERCVCTGDKQECQRLLYARYIAADRSLKKHFGKDWYTKNVADRPTLAIRFEFQHGDGVGYIALSPDVWFQVSYMCQGPVRPTLIRVVRNLADDRLGLLGMNPSRHPDGVTGLWWHTMWELVFMLDMSSAIKLSFYLFVGDRNVQVHVIEPWRQRVKAIEYDPVIIWNGYSTERAKIDAAKAAKVRAAAALRDRARGRGGRGGRGRGRGRGLVAIADADVELIPAGGDLVDAVGDAAGEEPEAPALLDPPDMAAGVEVPHEVMFDEAEDLVAEVCGIVGGCADHDIESDVDAVGGGDPFPEGFGVLVPSLAGDDLVGPAAPTPLAAIPHLPPPIGVRPIASDEAQLPTSTSVTIVHGTIKYYRSTKRFVAQCPTGRFPTRCHLTRTSRNSGLPDFAGQGRPLGLLMAWLMFMDVSLGREFQTEMFIPDHHQRLAGREFLETLASGDADARVLLDRCERPRRTVCGEPPEPLIVC